MKKGSTLFLKCAIIFIGLVVLSACVYMLITAGWGHVDVFFPFLIGLNVTAIPFFIALWQTFKLLSYIDANTAFSELSVVALKKIKYCALTVAGIFVLGMPYIAFILRSEDVDPPLGIFSMIIIFASVVIAVFAAVLEKLVRSAIALKAENDLTV